MELKGFHRPVTTYDVLGVKDTRLSVPTSKATAAHTSR